MKPLKPACLLAFALALLPLAPVSVQALPSDREQPIHIQSDTAERDEKQGITTYRGDVQMDQGTLRIKADKVVIHSVDNQVSVIVATGKPARYKQTPELNKPEVKASGNTIEYLVSEEKLHLIKNASLVQNDGTTMTGERINYDMKDAVVKAAGQTSSTRPKRIHMVIPPKSERQKANGE
ncbi:MAG: lipopolysaccharide transport periplasmic protein LptA [Pseudomonadota bacterium]|nr:lipopolysaccharide transport periplasmic protein LptA [Pseudomonadota bacterium]